MNPRETGMTPDSETVQQLQAARAEKPGIDGFMSRMPASSIDRLQEEIFNKNTDAGTLLSIGSFSEEDGRRFAEICHSYLNETDEAQKKEFEKIVLAFMDRKIDESIG